jgi:peptidoglycan hydrolase-like protein with peptidoglycan-binding domain
MPAVPVRRTHVTSLQVYNALRAAWRRRFNSDPAHRSLLLLLAQWAFETDHGRSCWNYNIGNAKSRGKTGLWTHYRCSEIINGKEEWFDPPHPQTRFRAFESLEDGAADYLQMMRTVFDLAWPELIAGNAPAFVAQLRAEDYFTASLAKYTAGIVSLVKMFDSQIGPDGKPREKQRTLEKGMVGDDVAELNRSLAALAYDAESRERWDVFDSDTDRAVREFQKDAAIKIDGEVGPMTRTEIANALAARSVPRVPPGTTQQGRPVRLGPAVARGTSRTSAT